MKTSKPIKSEAGFTLLEAMAAMAIFGILVAGTIPVFSSFLKANTSMDVKSGGIQAAQRVLDRLRVVDPRTLPDSGSDSPEQISVDGRNYQVTTSYCENATLCESENNRHISIDVVFSGKKVFDVETVFTRLR